ncbi:sigma-70 family RNA polymerase sigma factor [Streptomyces scabiei]|uniref:RNA polymerase sigma factor n=1 Tax=Streptomyces scabiei TaxID=1930 RepID=UPI0029904379|nr:sigma-70 family RNA polymerase sigma factor [Streptomyces scabiei]MDW8805499.1 sigma-70 family RNA polymerase sigma factor [Streptomyces scabiei]
MTRPEKKTERLLPAHEGEQQASGLPQDFNAFYEKYNPMLRFWVRTLLTRDFVDNGDDVLQRIWMMLIKKWTDVLQLQHPEAYLRMVAKNAVVDHFRSSRHQISFNVPTDDKQLIALAGASDDEGEISQFVDQQAMSDLLQRLAKYLSPSQVTILAMEVEGRDVPEIAQSLGVTTSTVRVQRMRIRKKLNHVAAGGRLSFGDEDGL